MVDSEYTNGGSTPIRTGLDGSTSIGTGLDGLIVILDPRLTQKMYSGETRTPYDEREHCRWGLRG